ncbi:hypothetical protein B4135_3263 [Caldibacillus debilis]|uniref:Uncharacterized protein n=1 Tax=Caldibacillus debilis TaxID=301148 RepID=A0A150LFP4_9BACI|nr:hypothetical protein B4135_3263 [Caldibacillus debilis]
MENEFAGCLLHLIFGLILCPEEFYTCGRMGRRFRRAPTITAIDR